MITHKANINQLIIGVLLLPIFLLIGCKKTINQENSQELNIVKIDRSIPTDYDIVEFDIVSENVCFAFGKKAESFKLFKTFDGGQNWEEMNGPGFNIINDLVIQSIVFFDNLNGLIVLNDQAYRTYDGGESWSEDRIKFLPPPGISEAFNFIFAGKTEKNELLLVESTRNSYVDNRMFISHPDSDDYTEILSFKHDGGRYDYGVFTNNKFFYLSRSHSNWDYYVYSYNFEKGKMDTLKMYNSPMDLAFNDDKIIFAYKGGIRELGGKEPYYWDYDKYGYMNTDRIGFSIEQINNYFVVVSNKTIGTNYRGNWERVPFINNETYANNFMKIQKIDNANFYISGTEGLFIKASFE